MKTLFVDTSRKSLSIALADNDELLFISNVESYSKHSNYLMDEIKKVLSKFNLAHNDIDNFIVLNGPGSFTGIRVGVTVCKTLAWALHKKLYQLNNLEALKVGINNEVIISVIPDKKDFGYIGIYDGDQVLDYMNINDERLLIVNKNISIVTMENNNFVDDLKKRLSVNNKVDVKIINDYDYLKIISYVLSRQDINPHLAEPIYLKKIDAEKKYVD